MPARPPRILCVDSHDDNRALLELLLTQAGYEVRATNTIAAALRLAETEQFDLYLFDGRCVDGTGLELCHRIRQFDRHTPVIFFTALAQPTDKRHALAAGAQAYLVKPNDLGQLVETAGRLTGTHRPPSAPRFVKFLPLLRFVA